MNRPAGYKIKPHIHNQFKKCFIPKGFIYKIWQSKVWFYDDAKVYLESNLLIKGDIILLASGGHGFEMIEDSEIVEVKQGLIVEKDKERFEGKDIKLENNLNSSVLS